LLFPSSIQCSREQVAAPRRPFQPGCPKVVQPGFESELQLLIEDEPTDIRQVSVNRVTLGVILSTAVLAGSISWSSSCLVSRLDAVEATVEAIQDSMVLHSYARVEDLDHLHQRVDGLTDDLDGVMDSVGLLLMEDEQSWWPDD